MRFIRHDLEGVNIIKHGSQKDFRGYSKQIHWIDKETYDVLKIEYYDHQNELRKTLTLTGYQTYSNNFRHARQMNMTNHETGKSMRVDYSNFRFDNGVEGIILTDEKQNSGVNLPPG
jgi:outer membrane lipoprotein-sorting protein